MSSTERRQAIISVLLNRREDTMSNLAVEFGVSRRTIFSDIEELSLSYPYNCSVASRPTIESETKEDNIEPGTETLSLTADPREDGLVKARTGDDTTDTAYANWYKAVYVPAAAEINTDDDGED